MCKLLQWACSNEVDVATKIAEKFCQSVEKEVRVFTILLIMCERCVLCCACSLVALYFTLLLNSIIVRQSSVCWRRKLMQMLKIR